MRTCHIGMAVRRGRAYLNYHRDTGSPCRESTIGRDGQGRHTGEVLQGSNLLGCPDGGSGGGIGGGNRQAGMTPAASTLTCWRPVLWCLRRPALPPPRPRSSPSSPAIDFIPGRKEINVDAESSPYLCLCLSLSPICLFLLPYSCFSSPPLPLYI